jgi:DNA mismatch repair protein MutH
MKIITRKKAIENLEKYKGQNLRALADNYNITVFKDGKQNKGWKGHVLERLAGLENDNKQAPNGLGFELKSVAFEKKDGILVPKETMAITMINPEELKKQEFFKSHCWEKLKSLVLCAVLWNDYSAEDSELLEVSSLDFSEDDELINEIKEDYDFIRKKLINNGFKSLTGKDGKWIQARTKGPGHGSTSRAFYARRDLVKKMCDM